MAFGGPVWHASVFQQQGLAVRQHLAQQARIVLAGVGDQTQQWEAWTGRCLHVRRRLTPDEATLVGGIRDIRGTDEARQRFAAMDGLLTGLARRIALEEIAP